MADFRSPTSRLFNKRPSRRERAKWQALITLCTNKIIVWPSKLHMNDTPPKVNITWKLDKGVIIGRPDNGFPRHYGNKKSDDRRSITCTYNMYYVLDYFWQWGYVDYNTADLWKQRMVMAQGLYSGVVRDMEKFMDIGYLEGV